METINLKKGLFGYTQSSVEEYIKALNSELSGKTSKLVSENEQLTDKLQRGRKNVEALKLREDELLEKISDLSKEIDALKSDKSELDKQLANLRQQLASETQNKVTYEQNQNELADVMIEAKRFANDLKEKTQLEYAQKKAANNELINKEKLRIEKYIQDIDELCKLLKKTCGGFETELNSKKSDLNIILGNLSTSFASKKSTE